MSETGSNAWTSESRWTSSNWQMGIQTLMLAFVWGYAITADAQPPSSSVLAAEPLLSTPITLTVDEQPADELMRQILASVSPAATAKIRELTRPIRSLWIDRRVDLSVRVSLSEAATPAAKVILDLAERQDLAVFPLPGVLVVGRESGWIPRSVNSQ